MPIPSKFPIIGPFLRDRMSEAHQSDTMRQLADAIDAMHWHLVDGRSDCNPCHLQRILVQPYRDHHLFNPKWTIEEEG